MTHRWPECIPVRNTVPIGTAITRKGPQMTMKWGAQSLVDRIFAKHNVAGTLLLKRELALMSSAIWVQAQQAIVKKVKQEFAEDGIPVILDPTPFKFTQQEIVDHGEILTDDKDYTPAAAGDDHTLT